VLPEQRKRFESQDLFGVLMVSQFAAEVPA
jgi:hypothetical protein